MSDTKQFIRDYLKALSGNAKPRALVDLYVADSDQELKDHIAFFEVVFPKYELVAEDMVAEGDKVAVRVVLRGVHKGEFMGLPPTNIAVEVPGMLIYRVEDNKIVQHWMQVDQLDLMQQLGMLPTPASE